MSLLIAVACAAAFWSPLQCDAIERNPVHRRVLAPSLLQTAQKQRQGNAQTVVPTDFFSEDALSYGDIAPNAVHMDMAPFDVGANAVPLPSQYKDTLASLPPPRQPLVLAESSRSRRMPAPSSSHSFFDDEDVVPAAPAQQTQRSAERPSLLQNRQALLAQQAAMEMAAQQAAAEEEALEEQTRPKQSEPLYQQLQPTVTAMVQTQPSVATQTQKSRSDESQDFFEAMSDVAGKDDRGGASASWKPAPVMSLTQSFAKAASGATAATAATASTAATAPDDGHSMMSSYNGYTGEGGEAVQNFPNPNLAKLMFPNKPEPMLKQERFLLGAEDQLVNDELATKKAYAKLKAVTYQSVNGSRYRLADKLRLENYYKRAQLLADANRYRAQQEQTSRLRSQEQALLERDLHIAGATADRERDAQEHIKHELLSERAALADAEAGGRQAQAEELNALEEAQREAQQHEQALVDNVSASLAGAGSQEGVDLAASRYSRWAGRVGAAEAAAAQRASDIRTYLGAADRVASQGEVAFAQQGHGITAPQAESPLVAVAPGQTIPSLSEFAQQAGTTTAQPPVQPSTPVSQPSLPSASTGPCTPTCQYRCQSQKCDEVCTPQCEAPQCQTRCQQPSLAQCKMECEQPVCSVQCPQRMCPNANSGCMACTSSCQEAVCKLNCPSQQTCRNVCATPKCNWNCSAPSDCPKPKCELFCETPRTCPGMSHSYGVMPPLQSGESQVSAFTAPLGLMQVAANTAGLRGTASNRAVTTLRVPVTTAELAQGPAAWGSEPPVALREHFVDMPLVPPTSPQHQWERFPGAAP